MNPRLSFVRAFIALTATLATTFHSSASYAIGPHRSISQLPTGNGYGYAVFDVSNARLQQLTERPYAERSMGNQTRDLVYDSYFGLRAQGEGAWLGERPVLNAEYREQTQVIRSEQRMGPLKAETFVWSPWGLESSSVAMVLHVTNDSRVTVNDGAAYALMNLHLGAGAPEPSAGGERVTWDNNARAFSETGPSGLTMRYVALGAVSQHGTGANNPYFTVRNGGNLDNVDDSGTRDDAVAAMQWSFAPMAPGAEQWVGVVLTLGSVESVRSWEMARAPNVLVDDEVRAWNSWRVTPPMGLSADETMVWRQSETVLRMAQVREPPPSRGQIVAALPPGIWWISWVRDMSYAMAALARSGHRDEAGLGVDFLRGATVGDYRMYVGTEYSISVVRYYGDGREWSDTDANGPNVEFDGFGLAAWAARSAGRMELDNAVAPLRMLIDPDTGMIKADSGPWEVHWNGQQKRFGYTSITAANGFCAVGDSTNARNVRDGILRSLLFPNGAIAGNYEELKRSQPARDAAVVEAINFGLIDPLGPVAQATLDDFEHLRTNVGRGYARNDDGGGYDSQEWVFIDLRVADALNRAGRTADARELTQWVTLQAKENYGLHAELYHQNTGDYAGAIPMVGFGAGAYMLTLMDRVAPEPRQAQCFPWEGAAGPSGPSVGSESGPTMSGGGCSVSGVPARSSTWWSLLSVAGAMLFTPRLLRRSRK